MPNFLGLNYGDDEIIAQKIYEFIKGK